MDRRAFLAASVAAGAGMRSDLSHGAEQDTKNAAKFLDLSQIPNFCSHEHWGSISSIGFERGVFRADGVKGATPNRKTTLVDVIVEPYLNWSFDGCGVKLDSIVRDELGFTDLSDAPRKAVVETVRVIRPYLKQQQLVGIYQCTRQGILSVYNFDINSDNPVEIIQANDAVGRNYSDIFGWYKRVMKRTGFSELIRCVHPEFYVNRQSDALATEEMIFTNTVMRIDPFLELWEKSTRKEMLSEIAGVEPDDAKSWRQFLDKIFEIALKGKAVGIKQLQAYFRDLNFKVHEDNEVKFSGKLNEGQRKVFGNWVVNECCKRANDLNWPHQVHVGTHNLSQSSPLPLLGLAKRYPKQKIVMLHCWPFLEEAGHLAKYYANIYIDSCWQQVLSPQFFREAIGTWLEYVPYSKIMMANDSTTIEMAAGSVHFSRKILGEVLPVIGKSAGIAEKELLQIAADMLGNNAVDLYKIGKKTRV